MTTVEEFMTTRLVTMSCDDTLTEAAQKMRDSDIGDVIVTRDDNVVGVVTDRDITVRAVADMLDPQRATLSQIISSDLMTVSRHDDAAHRGGPDAHVRRTTVAGDRRRPADRPGLHR